MASASTHLRPIPAGALTRREFGVAAAGAVLAAAGSRNAAAAEGKRLAYLTPGLDLPFWRTLAKGIEDTARTAGGASTTYDSHNSAQTQLQNAQDAIAKQVDGLIISPTDSSTAPAVLALAQRANIPVVIADIGTTGGEYVSFIISDNEKGAYGVGQQLAAAMKAKGWDKGTVGLVTISLARNNGKARTGGFMKAMDEAGIKQGALSQMQTYTADETFKFVQDMLTAHPDLRGLFIETDQPSLGALRAIHSARRDDTVLLSAFDGIPDFIPMIEQDHLVASGMQQPYLMGQTAGQAMLDHFAGKTPDKQILVPILIVDKENLKQLEPTVRKTVFGE
jgi:ribose transport system substrate-binding protein